MSSNLKELCNLARIKQTSLSREIGVSQSVISDWMNGKVFPSAENLIHLSRTLGVSVDCVLGLAPIPEGYPDTNVKPVICSAAANETKNTAENSSAERPAKKLPFNKEQIAYLDEWGKTLKDNLADAVIERLQQNISSSEEEIAK